MQPATELSVCFLNKMKGKKTNQPDLTMWRAKIRYLPECLIAVSILWLIIGLVCSKQPIIGHSKVKTKLMPKRHSD